MKIRKKIILSNLINYLLFIGIKEFKKIKIKIQIILKKVQVEELKKAKTEIVKTQNSKNKILLKKRFVFINCN